MHNIRVVLAGKYVTGSPHIRRKLVHIIIGAVNNSVYNLLIAQIADNKFVGNCFGKIGILQVNAFDPIALSFEALYKMTADKSACAADESCAFRTHNSTNP